MSESGVRGRSGNHRQHARTIRVHSSPMRPPSGSKAGRRIQDICHIHNTDVWGGKMRRADDSQALKRQLLRIEAEKGMLAKPKRDDVSWPHCRKFPKFVVFLGAENGKNTSPERNTS